MSQTASRFKAAPLAGRATRRVRRAAGLPPRSPRPLRAPGRIVHAALRAAGRRSWAAVGRFRHRWRRSLQLRVVGTTTLISVGVVTVLGFFLIQQIAGGLLASEQSAALSQTDAGLAYAQGQDTQSPLSPAALLSLARSLQSGSGPGDVYYVVVFQRDSQSALVGVDGHQSLAASIPAELQEAVAREQLQSRSDKLLWRPTMLVGQGGRAEGPALAVGVPISDATQLYYLFPLNAQQQTLSLVQTAVIGAGVALVLLLALIVSLVTRWVVVPIRQASQAASRLSGGDLGERMAVRGTDELSALAKAFNGMAASLQEKLRELEALSMSQRQFVSDVSHELRTPLTTIRLAADVLLAAREQLGATAGRSAELLHSQLERFEALLADLLEISKYDANVVTLDAETADVCDLVRLAAADAEQLAARRGTRIDFRFPPGPCIAEVDRRRIERVLRNLLDNAVEHGEGQDVVVTVAADRDAVAVAVRDHGVGFGPGDEQRVFERFWRADPARARTTGGTGLGLAIALEDTRLHGGWLQAWGEPGNGSVFRLTLPRSTGGELVGSPLPLGPDQAELSIADHGAADLGAGLGADQGAILGVAPGDGGNE